MENVIEIVRLTKDYETGFWRKRRVRALDGVDLTVGRGEIFGFLGGNGAGKTTTIKILMGLLFPTSGEARILGERIDRTDTHARIGYCPENPYFYDHLTPLELLDYFGRLFGMNALERRRKAPHLLTRVGLDERDWRKQLRKFSKGMLQRVGLAQALLNDPEVVFLDEPMSGLDPVGRRDVRDLIAGLRQTGTTVFMSTHILSDAETLCDQVAILADGRVSATGPLSSLLSQDASAREFELLFTGINTEQARTTALGTSPAKIEQTATGIRIVTADEGALGELISSVTRSGGSLISVTPVRQSLEDVFVAHTQVPADPAD